MFRVKKTLGRRGGQTYVEGHIYRNMSHIFYFVYCYSLVMRFYNDCNGYIRRIHMLDNGAFFSFVYFFELGSCEKKGTGEKKGGAGM